MGQSGGLVGAGGPPSRGYEAELKGGDSVEISWVPGVVQSETCVAPGNNSMELFFLHVCVANPLCCRLHSDICLGGLLPQRVGGWE